MTFSKLKNKGRRRLPPLQAGRRQVPLTIGSEAQAQPYAKPLGGWHLGLQG